MKQLVNWAFKSSQLALVVTVSFRLDMLIILIVGKKMIRTSLSLPALCSCFLFKAIEVRKTVSRSKSFQIPGVELHEIWMY